MKHTQKNRKTDRAKNPAVAHRARLGKKKFPSDAMSVMADSKAAMPGQALKS